jgi:hypothetical protein
MELNFEIYDKLHGPRRTRKFLSVIRYRTLEIRHGRSLDGSSIHLIYKKRNIPNIKHSDQEGATQSGFLINSYPDLASY